MIHHTQTYIQCIRRKSIANIPDENSWSHTNSGIKYTSIWFIHGKKPLLLIHENTSKQFDWEDSIFLLHHFIFVGNTHCVSGSPLKKISSNQKKIDSNHFKEAKQRKKYIIFWNHHQIKFEIINSKNYNVVTIEHLFSLLLLLLLRKRIKEIFSLDFKSSIGYKFQKGRFVGTCFDLVVFFSSALLDLRKLQHAHLYITSGRNTSVFGFQSNNSLKCFFVHYLVSG